MSTGEASMSNTIMGDDKDRGLYPKYKIEKLSNPGKNVDAIVLEFDDPIARAGILGWAEELLEHGYDRLALEVSRKVREAEEQALTRFEN